MFGIPLLVLTGECSNIFFILGSKRAEIWLREPKLPFRANLDSLIMYREVTCRGYTVCINR